MADPSCRILTLSSSRDGALQFLQRLVRNDLPTVTDHPFIIPWTIANKYYTADVHFQVHQLPEWTLSDEVLESVPAILYTWTAGEPYRENVQMISQRLSHHEFEVSLAIQLPSTTVRGERTEDEDDMDAFLGSLGFEFIDVQNMEMPSAPHDRGGVARAIDALSTIMWPSMIQNTSKGDGHGLLRTAYDTEEDISSLITMRPAGGHDRTQQELETLEKWLEEDNSDGHSDISEESTSNDPWSTAATTYTASPIGDPPTRDLHINAFDDDFTAFISASSSTVDAETAKSAKVSSRRQNPLPSSSFSSTFAFDSGSDTSGQWTPNIDEQDSSRLLASEFTASYRSLGSDTDLGNPELEESHNKEDSDDDMPSSAEIAATSKRIFGATPLTHIHTDGTRSPQGNPLSSGVKAAIDPSEADLERVDLQSMLSALQGFKEEIAGMSDSRERERAAARVALGLVYGLDGNSG